MDGTGEDFAVLHFVTQHYLDSEGFRGCAALCLAESLELSPSALRDLLVELVEADSVSLVFGDITPNPTIKTMSDEPHQVQLDKLRLSPLEHVYIYPTFSTLRHAVDPLDFDGRPFSLRLALGEPQFSFETFSLEVLERYRDASRYHYACSDISGSIWLKEGDSEDALFDRPLLRSFGFANDVEGNRAVAVFLCYLARLDREEQTHWYAHALDGDYDINPDFYRVQVSGEWPERLSIFDALVEELHQINKICAIMGRYPLFDHVPPASEKPKHLSFLVRPTKKEFHDFLAALDGLLSENVSLEFFGADLKYVIGPAGQSPPDGAQDASSKQVQGDPLAILERWLLSCFRTPDPEPLYEIARAFRQVRIFRYQSRIDLDDSTFDAALSKKQRLLMKRVYQALRGLRSIFESHPAAAKHRVPKQLAEGLIWAH